MNEITRDKILYNSGIILFLIVFIETLWLQLEIIEITVMKFEGIWVALIGMCPLTAAYIIGLWVMSKTRHCWKSKQEDKQGCQN